MLRGFSSFSTLGLLLCAALSAGCDSNADSVCESVADCERGGDSEWITACQDEAKTLSDEAGALDCSKAFDDYYDCANQKFRCNGATASFPNCDDKRAALETCFSQSQGKSACSELLERKQSCANEVSGSGGEASTASETPTACTLARDCAARCYLDQVGDSCTPDAAELQAVDACAESCPP